MSDWGYYCLTCSPDASSFQFFFTLLCSILRLKGSYCSFYLAVKCNAFLFGWWCEKLFNNYYYSTKNCTSDIDLTTMILWSSVGITNTSNYNYTTNYQTILDFLYIFYCIYILPTGLHIKKSTYHYYATNQEYCFCFLKIGCEVKWLTTYILL